MDPQEQSIEALEEWLGEAGRTLRYPPAPPLSPRVAARLRAEPPPRRRFQTWLLSGRRGVLARPPFIPPLAGGQRGVAVALVLAALALGVAAGLFPPARGALAEFFGLGRIQVVPIEGTPTVPRSSGLPAALEALAGRTSLEEARQRAGFPLRLPTYPDAVGDPDAVYFQDMHPGEQVVLVYLSRPGLKLDPPTGEDILFTLFQFRTEGILQKLVSPQTLVAEVEVGGSRALWFQGTTHWLQYRDPEGNVRVESRRSVEGNTLVWEVGEVTYRLETELPVEEARRIADSLHRAQ